MKLVKPWEMCEYRKVKVVSPKGDTPQFMGFAHMNRPIKPGGVYEKLKEWDGISKDIKLSPFLEA
jgi:hypothetical protein